MKIATLFFVSISLAGCESTDLGNALYLASAYYGGRAQGYQNYSAQHDLATVIVPGQTTAFIGY